MAEETPAMVENAESLLASIRRTVQTIPEGDQKVRRDDN